MANHVGMELVGLKELVHALKFLPKEIKAQSVLMRALHDGARIIRDEARRLAPVLKSDGQYQTTNKRGKKYTYTGSKYRRAGALRSGIIEHTDRHNYDTVLVRVRSRGYIFGEGKGSESHRAGNPNYWWLVEFGTSKMAAQPFMRPAFESKKFAAAAEIRNSLRRGLEVVWAKFPLKRAA